MAKKPKQNALRPAALVGAVALALVGSGARAQTFKILQPLGDRPEKQKNGSFYIPTTPETVRWGSLPNALAKPILSVPSGSVVTFDTVSHEGILEDQGKDPVKFFGQHGIEPAQVLK